MNMKLEVIRLSSKDVVTTSLPHSASYTHYYVSNTNSTCDMEHKNFSKIVVKVESGIKTPMCYGYSQLPGFPNTPNTWFFVDENGYYGICTDVTHQEQNIDQYAQNNSNPHMPA